MRSANCHVFKERSRPAERCKTSRSLRTVSELQMPPSAHTTLPQAAGCSNHAQPAAPIVPKNKVLSLHGLD